MTFAHFAGILEHPLAKLVLLGLIWAYLQHFCAGVRHLFMDMHMGIEKDSSRQSRRQRAGRQPGADRAVPALNCLEYSDG